MKKVLIIFSILWASEGLLASGDRLDSYFAETAPELDGNLDDQIWSDAPFVTGFKTFVPDYSKDMDFETRVYWSHDEDNIYFAFQCQDQSDLIKTSIAARDRIDDDDWICINLDSFNDRQTLYAFYVNPNGIQMDSRYTAGREDPGIDMVWYSAGRVTEQGYNVEVKIPFKSIRYAVKDGIVDMGVIFERKISRLSTQGTYPALDPAKGANFLTQTMPIHFEGVKKTTLIELLPSLTYANSAIQDEGETIKDEQTELSLTTKFGITSDLVLDATYNPDFSQVEADAVQIEVNQRFPVFYPEKRPFFQEGSEHFRHSGGSGRSEIRSIVNTRSIVNPLAAGKITGKVGKKNIVSAVGAIDRLDTTYNANVGVFRYKRTFQKDSYLGGFWTGRSEEEFYNTVYGLDGQYRIGDASLLSGFYFKANSKESEVSDVTDKSAMAGNYSYRNRSLSTGFGFTNIDTDFASAVGYVTRTGITKYNVYFSPKFYPSESLIKRIDPLIYVSLTEDKPSGLFEHSIYTRVGATLPRNTQLEIAGNASNEIYEGQKFDRGSLAVEAESQITKRINLEGEFRLRYRPYYDEMAQGEGKSVEGNVIIQFSDNFNFALDYNFSDLYSKNTGEKFYDIHIIRSKNTYQVNQYLFIRAWVQYNSYSRVITPNFLASFTYIPGTVVHLGYGSVMERVKWDAEAADYVDSRRYMSTARGLFFKASYLWRL